MAYYEYKCEDECLITLQRAIDDRDNEVRCEAHSKLMLRIISSVAIQFKGSGFYKTDNK
jgi:predicted nucleic acid-binding Zn ribbon protein